MGKIISRGEAVKEYTVDKMIVSVTVSKESQSEKTAVTEGRNITEKVLADLQEFGIELEEIQLLNENIRSYDKKICFEKTMKIQRKADLAFLNELIRIVSSHEGVLIRTDFDFYDKKALQDEVMLLAVDVSRKKAEKIAEKLGQKIVGAKKAVLDQHFNSGCIEGVTDILMRKKLLADKISLKKEEIRREVEIVWLTE